MNLKGFHLLFIACSSALAFLFGVWVLHGTTLTGTPRLAAACGAFAIGIGLILYETWFLRFLRRSR